MATVNRRASLSMCLALAVLLGFGSSSSGLQARTASRFPSDERVQELLELALRFISRARCENDQPCKPATEQEMRTPPVAMSHAREAVRTGFLSAVAEKCGLDYGEKFFLPMMSHFRRSVGLNERQLAILGLMHGIELGSSSKSLPKDACSPEMKRLLSQGRPALR
ncbi:hypothetical protein ACFOYU_21965 [Microvirga sp. GCM10011540]|uniref:hypothetical protein n=1 Tax=Microvirga sp. GCM10011540 TaxID=3317338 RepID=UPI003617DCB7